MLLHQKKNHYLRIGLAITAVITAMALVGCFWTPYAPTAMSGSEKFAAPSLRHLFGTDNFGRDIFSRVMVGARTTFFISACTVKKPSARLSYDSPRTNASPKPRLWLYGEKTVAS